MSADADKTRELPAGLERLERAAEEAAHSLDRWRRRASETEAEVQRLRRSLEELAGGDGGGSGLEEEVTRLKAENAALHSRMLQARKRIEALMQRLATLEIEP